jgi:TolB-like protein/tRNA A-37 threonylcarbamoyl transferase component Bud32/Flp pilus assembly protein TadD
MGHCCPKWQSHSTAHTFANVNGEKERLQRALAGRYAIDHEVGRGGMAIVYLGRDERLGRRVAIKVFDRTISESATERFLREIRVAAQLQHPNIVPVFEAGESEGLVYYVMPYVAGASLRERLEREGPLPIGDAVRIAREVAEAIDHAHRAGIVHRDIKPDNIMLADGVAMVTDFGIARALADATTKVTETGVAIGTPSYMSPEQGAGAQQIDARTDIYSLGCVLYEMLAGSPPFSGSTPRIVMARHATDPPPPLRTARAVPPTLESIVLQAMAKLPGDRFATARVFADALMSVAPSAVYSVTARSTRRAWVAAAVFALTLLGSLLWKRFERDRAARAGTTEARNSVAVLPFEFSGDSSYRYFARGLTDGIVANLVQIPGIAIPAVGREADAVDGRVDPREAGRALKADKVVWGLIEVSANTMRVTARLLNVSDGLLLWQGHHDAELHANDRLRPVFAIQDSVAVHLVGVLRPRLAPERRALAARGPRTQNREAYRLYQRAAVWAGLNAHPHSIAARAKILDSATKLDSNFADAWAALAEAKQADAIVKGTRPVEAGPELRRLVAKALAIDGMNAHALMLQGRFRWFYDWDWDGALHDVRRAYEIAPSSVPIANQYQWLLTFANQHDSALGVARRALDTTSRASLGNLAQRFIYMGMWDSALVVAERAAAVASTDEVPQMDLMLLYHRLGRRREADSLALQVLALANAGHPNFITYMGDYYDLTGNREAARRMLDRLLGLTRSGRVKQDLLAMAYLNAGDREAAIAALERAVEDREPGLFTFFAEAYSRLRGDPRVEAAREKVFRGRPVPVNPFRP